MGILLTLAKLVTGPTDFSEPLSSSAFIQNAFYHLPRERSSFFSLGNEKERK